MKETISVNLASQAFTFDKDAYRRLKEYLDAIRRRLPAGDPEILNDVEARLAEIFRSRISSPMMVVTLQMVQGAMAQMGDPSEFGELPTGEKRDEASVDAESASCVSSRHLYRSRTNRSIAGVCGGIAEFFGIDPTILRLITLFLILFGGLSLWVYWSAVCRFGSISCCGSSCPKVPNGSKGIPGRLSPARDCPGRGLRISDMRTGPGY